MDFIVIRKLIAGVLLLLVASGVIKCEPVKKYPLLRIVLYVLGILMLIAAALYQFDVIPKSSRDALLK